MDKAKLGKAWDLLGELNSVLSRVGQTEEEWAVFVKIQGEVNLAKQVVSGKLDAIAA